MNKGKFITIDGVEGSGKSTQIDLICSYLQRKGIDVVRTREPGGTDLGEKIRGLLLNSTNMHKITELLLMFASRQELIHNVIMPNLTPCDYRKEYLLYEDKPCIDEDADLCRNCLEARIELAGSEIGYNEWGDSKHFINRKK